MHRITNNFLIAIVSCTLLSATACSSTQAPTDDEVTPPASQDREAIENGATDDLSESTEEDRQPADQAIDRARDLTFENSCRNPWDRTKALDELLKAVELDATRADEIAEEFGDILSGRVGFYEITGAFDSDSWEGLEEALVSAKFHESSTVAHLPWGSLTFDDDGIYTYEKRVTDTLDVDEIEFETIEGEWEISEAVPGEDYAIIALDGEEYVFGAAHQLDPEHGNNSAVYVLHPRSELEDRGSIFMFTDEEYEGEIC